MENNKCWQGWKETSTLTYYGGGKGDDAATVENRSLVLKKLNMN